MYRYNSPNLPRGWRYVMITESAHTHPRMGSRKFLELSLEAVLEEKDDGESRRTAGMRRWKMTGVHPKDGYVMIIADESHDGIWARVFHSHKMTAAEEARWLSEKGII